MRVLLAGASGLIGRALGEHLRSLGHETATLVRRPAAQPGEYSWHPTTGVVPAAALEWAEGVVSLSGAPLARPPWTRTRRRSILMSRVRATSAIAAALAAQPTSRRPNVWVAGSAVGIYGDRPAEVLSEDAVPGPGFLAGVVRAWEGAAAPAAGSVRLVLARTGMVVADGGAFAPLIVAARRGVSVSVGRGDQWWPWVALADEVRAIEHLLSASQLSGPVNLVGPVPATSGEIAADLAHRFRRRISLRLPPSPMRWVLGDAARDLLLASQLAIPARLNADRFEFRAPTVGEALGFALGQVR